MRIFAYNIIIIVGKGTITMRETRILEFKETITNTFLKTVSAFSNYNGGTILFGVDDNGNVKGLLDVNRPVWISKIKSMTVYHLNQTIHLKYRIMTRR